MSFKDRQLGQSRTIYITPGGAVTTSAANSSNQVQSPTLNTVALLQNGKLTDWVSVGEAWRPVGLQITTTTTTTVTVPAFTLQKNAVSPTSGGVAAAGALRTAPFGEYVAFTNYIAAAGTINYAAQDAVGDKWGILVSTTSTAGAVQMQLHYILVNIQSISDAFTSL